MGTRANIEFYDCSERDRESGTEGRLGAMLYHHADGYPSWMGRSLEKKLATVKERLEHVGCPHWWHSEMVAGFFAAFSTPPEGVPEFCPCMERHGDITFLWKVFLGPKPFEYEIRCFAV